MSFGFFGVLLGMQEIERLLYSSIGAPDSGIPELVHPFIGTGANLLGGFAAARLATLIRISRPIRYPFVATALVLGYVFFFLTFHWMPSISVFVIYTLPYYGAALLGAALAFRPWTWLLELRNTQPPWKRSK